MTTVEIKNGKVFINGEETTNPELIGYAILDVAEQSQNVEFIKLVNDSINDIDVSFQEVTNQSNEQ